LKKTNQLDLPIPKQFLETLERRGEFTGERLKERKPEVYQACVSLLGRGASYLSISKVLSISVNSVSAVARNEKIPIESEKRKLAGTMRLASGLGAERIVEALEDDERAKEIPLNQLAIAVGIMTEKAELLSGGATARHEWVAPAPSADDYQAYLASVRAEAVEVDAQVVSDGCSRPKTETKGTELEDGAALADQEPNPSKGGPRDE
tara:strand:+ start:6435 stop:7055 length:621 start_codon:yes stop_codon:yes gene_type:complete